MSKVKLKLSGGFFVAQAHRFGRLEYKAGRYWHGSPAKAIAEARQAGFTGGDYDQLAQVRTGISKLEYASADVVKACDAAYRAEKIKRGQPLDQPLEN